MKKLFGLLVVVGLMSLTACGGAKKADDAAADTTSTQAPPPAPEPAPEPAADTTKKEGEKKDGAHKNGEHKDGAKDAHKSGGGH
jgi:hypothetical protein